jgi:predicted nucleotidyltransferase
MPPVSQRTAPKIARVLLRLPADLHRALAKAAAASQLSFNEYCVRRLQAPVSAHEVSALPTLVVDRARALFGDRLIGVLALGSWARGTTAASSDIDVLIVIDAATPLTRDLYRAWDRAPLAFEGRAIDEHVAHLSEPGTPPTSVWCEAAVDGIVWSDRDGAIVRRLGEVRRAIADGAVVRAFAHGQPYWKGAA